VFRQDCEDPVLFVQGAVFAERPKNRLHALDRVVKAGIRVEQQAEGHLGRRWLIEGRRPTTDDDVG
jgi:hypothetical protein